MDINEVFSHSQVGLLGEALNIGAGNAVTALSQLLQRDTDMGLPVLHGFLSPLSSENIGSFLGNKTRVGMNIVGELQGGLVFVIPEDDENGFANLIRQAKEEQRCAGVSDISLVVEIANIMAGVFLTAIHDFCGLNIFHTVPIAGKGVPDSLHGILQHTTDDPDELMLLITNEFSIDTSNMKTQLLVLLSVSNASRLIQAIENNGMQ